MRYLHSAVVCIALLVQLLLPVNVGSVAIQLSSQEQINSGLALLHECTDAIRFKDKSVHLTADEYMSAMICMGYLAGFIDGYGMAEYQHHAQSTQICLPNQGTIEEQILLIVEKWLREHPERLHEQMSVLVADALGQAFPCK